LYRGPPFGCVPHHSPAHTSLILQTEGVFVGLLDLVAVAVRTGQSPCSVTMFALMHEYGLVRATKVLRKGEPLSQLQIVMNSVVSEGL
jgi:hypothetical protein